MIPLIAYAVASTIGLSAGVLYVNAARIIRGAGKVVASNAMSSIQASIDNLNVVADDNDKVFAEVIQMPTKEVIEEVLIKPEDQEVKEPEPVVETTFKK